MNWKKIEAVDGLAGAEAFALSHQVSGAWSEACVQQTFSDIANLLELIKTSAHSFMVPVSRSSCAGLSCLLISLANTRLIIANRADHCCAIWLNPTARHKALKRALDQSI